MDRIQEMTLFAAVAEQPSLAAAARHVGLSTATVTRAVAQLESRLGVLLVVRSTRGMRLTEAGERFALDCRRLLADIDAVESAAAGVHAAPSGLLTVTAPQAFGAQHVMPLLIRFLDAQPGIEIRALLLDRVVPMLEEGIDVAIRIGVLPDSSLTAIPVGTLRRMVCASPAYLAAHGAPVHPDQLRQHATITTSAADRARKWQFRVDGRAHAVDVGSRLSVTSYHAAVSAALHDGGLIQVPSYQVRAQLQQGRLDCVLESFEIAPDPVHVVYPEGRLGSAKVRAFAAFCAEALRDELRSGY